MSFGGNDSSNFPNNNNSFVQQQQYIAPNPMQNIRSASYHSQQLSGQIVGANLNSSFQGAFPDRASLYARPDLMRPSGSLVGSGTAGPSGIGL